MPMTARYEPPMLRRSDDAVRLRQKSLRSFCGPFSPPLRSFCGLRTNEQPRTRANTLPATHYFRGFSPVFAAVRGSLRYRGDRCRTARVQAGGHGVGGFAGGPQLLSTGSDEQRCASVDVRRCVLYSLTD